MSPISFWAKWRGLCRMALCMWRLAGRSAGKARRLVSVLKGEVFTSHYELFKCRVAVSDVAAAYPTPLPPFLFLSFFFFFLTFFLLFLYLTPYTLYVCALCTHIDLNTSHKGIQHSCTHTNPISNLHTDTRTHKHTHLIWSLKHTHC